MDGSRWLAIGVLAFGAVMSAGCQSPGSKQTAVSTEPGLIGAAEPEGSVAEGSTVRTTPVKTVGFADRHPLFTKPRQYWDTSGDNKIVKAAAATFIGVPVGFVGEVRQIIVGAPPETRF